MCHSSKWLGGLVAGLCAALALSVIASTRASATPSYAGVDLPWLGYGHSFGPDGLYGYGSSYSSSTAQSAFDDMKSKHLNICRVFIFDDLEGVISGGNLNTIITPSGAYISNLTDLVNRANGDGITVYITMFNAWDFVSYPSTLRINPSTIFNNSALYGSSGPIETVAHALAGKLVIWDFMNEGNNLAQYYSGGWKDIAGWVSMNSWISRAKSAIRAGGSTGNFTITINDPNVLLYQSGTSNSADLMNRGNFDFYDCHFYNDSGSIGISTSTIGDGKPCFVGEFGPSSNWSSTGDNKTALVDSYWSSAKSNGIQGILMWSYLSDGDGFQTQGTSELTELGNLAAAAGIGGNGTSAPSAPTGLTATAGNAQVTLSWTGGGGATSYNAYRGSTSGGEASTAIATGLTGTSYTNTGLSNGTTYYYEVASVNSAGTSGMSNEASATPQSSGGGNGNGSGPATVTAVQSSSSQWFGENDLTIKCSTSITSISATIIVQKSTGLTFGGEYTNYGAGITTANSTGSSTVTYTFTGSSISTTSLMMAAQYDLSGTPHSAVSDTYSITYGTGGSTYTATGAF